MEIVSWLQNWYNSNCDGSWEHIYGVSIDTLDNPGWKVKINLQCTCLEEKIFQNIFIDNGDEDWLKCTVQNGTFQGFGDPKKLIDILNIFREWSES
ncbi:MAG: immunity 53 family protein [Oscillospiraceae bacterium]|nr:immunity 53 family protein [Oscillospiraceae bacterium]